MKIIRLWMPRWFRFDAFTLAPFVFVRSGLNIHVNSPLLKHEAEHIRQQTVQGRCWFLLHYFFDSKYRARVELEAFVAQGEQPESALEFIMSKYNTDLTAQEFDALVKQVSTG